VKRFIQLVFVLLGIAWTLASCVDRAGAARDMYRTCSSAIAPDGDRVTGCVTRGFWFKGS
jgi:predicted small secreted protein